MIDASADVAELNMQLLGSKNASGSSEEIAIGIQARILLLGNTADTVCEQGCWLLIESFGHNRHDIRIRVEPMSI